MNIKKSETLKNVTVVEFKTKDGVRKLTSLKRFNSNGSLNYYRENDKFNFEKWIDYDNNGNQIRIITTEYNESYYYDIETEKLSKKYINNYEEYFEYDENNNMIYYYSPCNNKRFEEWRKYDENNNLIHYKDSIYCEEWYEYDENNNCIHCKHSSGYEEWLKYDENNNLICKMNNYEKEIYEYDGNNNCIYIKNYDDIEYWQKFDKNNNLIYRKDSKGLEETLEYNDDGNIIKYQISDGTLYEYYYI